MTSRPSNPSPMVPKTSSVRLQHIEVEIAVSKDPPRCDRHPADASYQRATTSNTAPLNTEGIPDVPTKNNIERSSVSSRDPGSLQLRPTVHSSRARVRNPPALVALIWLLPSQQPRVHYLAVDLSTPWRRRRPFLGSINLHCLQQYLSRLGSKEQNVDVTSRMPANSSPANSDSDRTLYCEVLLRPSLRRLTNFPEA